jgi:four helix bundle protein
MGEEKNLIINLTFDFSLSVIEYCELLEEKKKYVIARQLFKSGTSIGANVREAQHAESKADFMHKIKIAMKETEETIYWLDLCKSTPSYPDCDQLITKAKSIGNVISKIIITSKARHLK